MKYEARRCGCGSPTCMSWYVTTETAPRVHVTAYSERQVGVVVNALNALDNYTDHTDTEHIDRGGGRPLA